MKTWNLINIHSCSSKTYYTNKISIPKLFENSPFCNSKVTHASRNNYQVTFTLRITLVLIPVQSFSIHSMTDTRRRATTMEKSLSIHSSRCVLAVQASRTIDICDQRLVGCGKRMSQNMGTVPLQQPQSLVRLNLNGSLMLASERNQYWQIMNDQRAHIAIRVSKSMENKSLDHENEDLYKVEVLRPTRCTLFLDWTKNNMRMSVQHAALHANECRTFRV